MFINIEPVDGAAAGRLLVGVLLVRRYPLRLTNMLAAHDWVNINDTRCKTLVALFDQRGEPYFIRSDNGPKFVAKAAKRRLEAAGVETLYIEPGSPWENTYTETFIGRFGDELLKREVFANLLEAKVLVQEYRNYYNRERLHSALAYLPPAKFAASCDAVSIDENFTKELESATTLSQRLAQKTGSGYIRRASAFMHYGDFTEATGLQRVLQRSNARRGIPPWECWSI